MRGWQRVMLYGVACLALITMGSGSLWAQGSFVAGDVLITRRAAPVMDKDRTLTVLPTGSSVVAARVQSSWVLVAVRQEGGQSSDGYCHKCGQREWTHLFGPALGEEQPAQWIRGWVHVRNLYREADCGQSRITFENESGESAVVRLVGPSRREVFVPDGSARTVSNLRAGHYFILVRYSETERVVAGHHFDVEATATTYSVIRITLHGVIGGDYQTAAIPKEVFEAWGSSSWNK